MTMSAPEGKLAWVNELTCTNNDGAFFSFVRNSCGSASWVVMGRTL